MTRRCGRQPPSLRDKFRCAKQGRVKDKNDKLDARKLSTLLALNQLPTVFLPSADVSAWRALINHRRTLVRRRTMIKNQIRAVLRTFAYRCPQRSCWTPVGMVWLRSLTFDAVRHAMNGPAPDETHVPRPAVALDRHGEHEQKLGASSVPRSRALTRERSQKPRP